MKIAVPVEQGKISVHFGHCPTFTLYEIDEARNAVVATSVHPAPPHERGVLPRWLHDLGANVIIAGGMGQGAQALFAAKGIRVILGAAPADPDATVAKFLQGALQSEANLCDH